MRVEIISFFFLLIHIHIGSLDHFMHPPTQKMLLSSFIISRRQKWKIDTQNEVMKTSKFKDEYKFCLWFHFPLMMMKIEDMKILFEVFAA